MTGGRKCVERAVHEIRAARAMAVQLDKARREVVSRYIDHAVVGKPWIAVAQAHLADVRVFHDDIAAADAVRQDEIRAVE